MFAVAGVGIGVAMTLALIRALLGPTLYDRVLALNTFGTKTVLLIAVLGFLDGRPEFLDLALVYALINFIGTIAVLKYLEFGDLGRASGAGAGTGPVVDAGAGTDVRTGMGDQA
jgi:multicomponent Na+:H+ antiporter subunit F